MGHAIAEWARQNRILAAILVFLAYWAGGELLDVLVGREDGWIFESTQRKAIALAVEPDFTGIMAVRSYQLSQLLLIMFLYWVGASAFLFRPRPHEKAVTRETRRFRNINRWVLLAGLVGWGSLMIHQTHSVIVVSAANTYRQRYNRFQLLASLTEADRQRFDFRLFNEVRTPDDLDKLIDAMMERHTERSHEGE